MSFTHCGSSHSVVKRARRAILDWWPHGMTTWPRACLVWGASTGESAVQPSHVSPVSEAADLRSGTDHVPCSHHASRISDTVSRHLATPTSAPYRHVAASCNLLLCCTLCTTHMHTRARPRAHTHTLTQCLKFAQNGRSITSKHHGCCWSGT
jgi:hypothetical protein